MIANSCLLLQEKGFCTKNEFILLMLHKLNKVDPNDIDAAVKQFEKLDIDKSGILTTADVESQYVVLVMLCCPPCAPSDSTTNVRYVPG